VIILVIYQRSNVDDCFFRESMIISLQVLHYAYNLFVFF